MSGLFSKPKAPPPPPKVKIKLPPPLQPPPIPTTPGETAAPELAFLRSRARSAGGLVGLILSKLGVGSKKGPTTLGGTG